MDDLQDVPVDALHKRLSLCDDYRERRRLRYAIRAAQSNQDVEHSLQHDEEIQLPDGIKQRSLHEMKYGSLKPSLEHVENNGHPKGCDQHKEVPTPSCNEQKSSQEISSIETFEAMLQETTDLNKRRELRKLLRDMQKQVADSSTACHKHDEKKEISLNHPQPSHETNENDEKEFHAYIDSKSGPTNRHVYHVTKLEKCDEQEEIVLHTTVVRTLGDDFDKTDTVVTRNRINKRSGSVQVQTGSFLTVKRTDAASGKVQIESDFSLEIEAQSASTGTTSVDLIKGQAVVSDPKHNLSNIRESDEDEDDSTPPPNRLEFTKKFPDESNLTSGETLQLICQLEIMEKSEISSCPPLTDGTITWMREDTLLVNGRNGFTFSSTPIDNGRGLKFELQKRDVDAFDEGQYVLEVHYPWNVDEPVLRTYTYLEVAPCKENENGVKEKSNSPNNNVDTPVIGVSLQVSNATSPIKGLPDSSLIEKDKSDLPLPHPSSVSQPLTCENHSILKKDPTLEQRNNQNLDQTISKFNSSTDISQKIEESDRKSDSTSMTEKDHLSDKMSKLQTHDGPKSSGSTSSVGSQKSAPSSAKSAMNAFKSMDKQAHPEGGAKPNFMNAKKPTSSTSAVNAKQVLLDWCKEKTKGYEGVNVQNFSGSWSDGLAFCALIHHFYPDSFDFGSLKKENRRGNFKLAFDTAENLAGVPQLLDVEDMVRMKNPDWKCVFCYIQMFYQKLRNHDANAMSCPASPLSPGTLNSPMSPVFPNSPSATE